MFLSRNWKLRLYLILVHVAQTTFGGYLSGGGGDFSTSSSVRRVVGDEDRYKRSSVTYATSTSRDYYGSRDSLGAGSSGLVQGSTGGSNTYQRFESGSRRVEAREEGSTSSFVRQGLASNYSSRENIISQSATSPRYSAVRDSSLTSRNRQSFPPPSDDDEN